MPFGWRCVLAGIEIKNENIGMRLMHRTAVNSTYKPPQPRERPRWRCGVQDCTATVVNLPAHLDWHFASRSCPEVGILFCLSDISDSDVL